MRPVIGMFDSGVGGLSVMKEIRSQLAAQDIIYFSDQAHVPYGSRELDEVRKFSSEITRYLLANGAALIVVACNTASAAALHTLREEFADVPFVGMEPAVKPAAEQTRTGVVGVLATPATFQGDLYTSVVERFANGVTLLQSTCPGLVAQIEKGDLAGDQTRLILEQALRPMLNRNIDTVVLGCTHYPFVIPLIQEITGPGVRVIDPAPAIARQTGKMLQTVTPGQLQASSAVIRYITSGEPANLEHFIHDVLHETVDVERITWQSGHLVEKGRTRG